MANAGGSRQEMARRLGIATHTIQRILVDGKVPRFPETRSPRIVHAWIRIVSRLAVQLGHDARTWVEGIGIKWTDDVAEISRTAADSVVPGAGSAGRRRPPPSPAKAPGRDSWRTTPSPAASAPETGAVRRPRPVRIAVGLVAPFSMPLPGLSHGILGSLAARLVRSIVPQAELRFDTLTEARLGVPDRDVPDLVSGILAVPEGPTPGLDLATIPGLQVRVSAVALRRREDREAPPDWSELLPFLEEPRADLLCRADGPVRGLLGAQLEGSPGRWIASSGRAPEDLATTLVEETGRAEGRPVMLVEIESICREVAVFLENHEDLAGPWEPYEPAGATSALPSVPLALAWRKGSEDWPERLGAAMAHLFGSAARSTAEVYAHFLARTALRASASSPGGAAGARRWRSGTLALVPDLSSTFRDALCIRLAAFLADGIGAQRAAFGAVGPLPRFRERLIDTVRREGAILLPDRWHPALEQAIASITGLAGSFDAGSGHRPVEGSSYPELPMDWQDGPEEAEAMATFEVRFVGTRRAIYCDSCSALLHDGVHGGAGDRICRFCADREGRLRPREEVARQISSWMISWREDLAEDEARARTEEYMALMPAWTSG